VQQVQHRPAFEESNGRSPVPALPEEVQEEQLSRQVTHKLEARIAAYERVIAALEEKQKLYDDQEGRIRALSGALEEQQGRSRIVTDQLQETLRRRETETDAEREASRTSMSDNQRLEQRVNELTQEVALRKAHEESLLQRVSFMESELSVVSHKCQVAAATDAEAKVVIAEVDGLKLQRQRLQEQIQELGRQMAEVQEENWQLKEDRGREVDRPRAMLVEETQAKESLRLELQRCQDEVRDKVAEAKLAVERVEGVARQLVTTETEVQSLQAQLARERQHRQELDQKLGDVEMMKLSSILDEHRVVVRGIRTELDRARHELQTEKTRSNDFETDAATAKKDLVRGQRQTEEFKLRIVAQDELKEEIRTLTSRNESILEQMRVMQQDSRKMTDRCEKELAELKQSRQQLESKGHPEMSALLQDNAELKEQALKAKHKAEELQLLQDHHARALESAKDPGVRTEEIARHLIQVQDELESSIRDRNELHGHVDRVTAKFQEDSLATDQRTAELESLVEDRNNEIKLLMYRLQELSSRYVAVKGDPVDQVLAKYVNGYRPAVPFFRLSSGLYLFGRRQVCCKLSNEKPVFRVGGGFLGFEKFLETFASEELERLLTYELEDRTGEPKFIEGLKVKQSIEDSGMLEELRDQSQPSRSRSAAGLLNKTNTSDSRRSLNSSGVSLR